MSTHKIPLSNYLYVQYLILYLQNLNIWFGINLEFDLAFCNTFFDDLYINFKTNLITNDKNKDSSNF